MFERFTESARVATLRAREEAAALGHGSIGCEHLLVALATGPEDDAAAAALRRAGASADRIRAAVRQAAARGGLDAAALAAIGIDLAEVRRRAEDAFGPGALERRRPACGDAPRFSPDGKKALELALREAIARGDGHIGSEHVLLGVLRAARRDGPAARALELAGVAPATLRELLEGERSA